MEYYDCRTPEEITARLGAQSVRGALKAVIRIRFSDPKHHNIYWRAREMAQGISGDKYRNLEVYDRHIDSRLSIYKTDEKGAA